MSNINFMKMEVFSEIINFDNIIELIKKQEGFSSNLYHCPSGHLTIGYGFNLEQIKLPVYIADLWLVQILNDIDLELSKKIKFYTEIDNVRRQVLINMAYNIGIDGLLKFYDMIIALEKGDYLKASEEMYNSLWNKEVPSRAKVLIEIMKTGTYSNVD